MEVNLIDSASYGYKKVWDERRYLIKLAAVPMFINLVCTVLVYVFGYEDNFLRQAILCLPAAFAQGWVLAQLLRTILLLERWPIRLTEVPEGKIIDALLIRARGIISSTICYALLTYILYGFKQVSSYFLNILDQPPAGVDVTAGHAAQTDPDPIYFIPALALIYLGIWVFRLMWLYIPVSVLMPIGEFLKKTNGFVTILRMLGVVLIVVVPCFTAALLISNFLTSIVGGPNSDVARFLMVIVLVIVDMLIALITTASLTYAFKDILPHHPKAFLEPNK